MDQLRGGGRAIGAVRTRAIALRWVPELAALAVTLVLGALLLARVGGAPGCRMLSDLAQLLAAFLASASAARAARRSSGRLRQSWLATCGGCGAWCFGQVVYCWYELVLGIDSPFPSVADGGYLLFGFGAGAGLMLFPTEERLAARARWLLDGVITASALIVISWAFSLGAVAHSPHTGEFGFAISLAYPLEDILVLTVAISCLSRPTEHRRHIVTLSAGFSALAISDSLYVYLTARGTYETGGLADLGWISAFLIIAASAAHAEILPPAVPRQHEYGQDEALRPIPATMLPYLPVVLAGSVMASLRLQHRSVDNVELVAMVTTLCAVLIRQWTTVRQNTALLDEVQLSRAQLRSQAFTDQLTGLANRALFLDRLGHSLSLHGRNLRALAVLYCDLDDFKLVNDTLGHAAGDDLLIRVSDRLLGAVRSGDTVARLGGDEFAILLEDGDEPLLLGQRILDALQLPFHLGATVVTVRASVGLAEVSADAPTPTVDELLVRADLAMYAAKHAGKGHLATYTPDMTSVGALVMGTAESSRT
jgi:diguanylate cyclase (GGDEF)-like protein